MSISSSSALKLAKAGGNLEITESSRFTSTNVLALVNAVAASGGHITIHATNYTSASLLDFVEAAPSHVTIVI